MCEDRSKCDADCCPTYRIMTWDTEVQEFTPQDGVPEIAKGWRGLRSAMRSLRLIGYVGGKGDSLAMVVRIPEM